MLKILHTGDLHIGMKFNGYPENLRAELVEARYKVLENLVARASEERCQLFVISGDLFDKITVPRNEIEKVKGILEEFSGDCVLVIPGNHDFDNGMTDLWKIFQADPSDKILLLNEERVFKLSQTHNIDVAIYPAPCSKKKSSENALGWMKDHVKRSRAKLQIGVAHGSLEGLSPDLHREYFYMTVQELESIPVDLWLLGHTHIPYPSRAEVTGGRIFNAGTPEPDGMDCLHKGHAWLIEIDERKKIRAKRLDTGLFRFLDCEEVIEDWNSLEAIKRKYLSQEAGKTLLRLRLKGRVDREIFESKEVLYQEFKNIFAYFAVDDSELRTKISPEVINREFTAGSLPYKLLSELQERNDEEALQVAYELIQEVKDL